MNDIRRETIRKIVVKLYDHSDRLNYKQLYIYLGYLRYLYFDSVQYLNVVNIRFYYNILFSRENKKQCFVRIHSFTLSVTHYYFFPTSYQIRPANRCNLLPRRSYCVYQLLIHLGCMVLSPYTATLI